VMFTRNVAELHELVLCILLLLTSLIDQYIFKISVFQEMSCPFVYTNINSTKVLEETCNGSGSYLTDSLSIGLQLVCSEFMLDKLTQRWELSWSLQHFPVSSHSANSPHSSIIMAEYSNPIWGHSTNAFSIASLVN
jgi:hypothetical protein